MKSFIRRTHIILAIGGSFTGAVLTLQGFFTSKEANPVVYAMYVGFVALYAYGIFAGLAYAEDEKEKTHLIAFYCLQIPWISSPLVGYRFTSGFNLSGAIIGGKLNGGFRIGSDWQLNLLQAIPWGIGLNLFALAMVVLLIRTKKPDKAPEPASGTITPPEPQRAPVPPAAHL